jgi:hypothetical protein
MALQDVPHSIGDLQLELFSGNLDGWFSAQ